MYISLHLVYVLTSIKDSLHFLCVSLATLKTISADRCSRTTDLYLHILFPAVWSTLWSPMTVDSIHFVLWLALWWEISLWWDKVESLQLSCGWRKTGAFFSLHLQHNKTWKISFLQVCKYSNFSDSPRGITRYYTPGYGNWKVGMLVDYQNGLFPPTHFRNVPKTFSCIQTPSSRRVLEK